MVGNGSSPMRLTPAARVIILMGKTDPKTARHNQQSMVLIPIDTPRGEYYSQYPDHESPRS
ncbi:MAG: hypothetical protein CM1200mP18_00510 [Gammaproteobacteria bacterium]|nr:MAG: hypothetical protein CM1200mP18_00510 [Gammaproteobacteria bacterium]